MNYFEGGRAVCPYYKGEGKWFVRCACSQDGGEKHLMFPGKTALIRHLSQICGSFYYKSRCPMAESVTEQYENRLKMLCMERIVLSRRTAERRGAR